MSRLRKPPPQTLVQPCSETSASLNHSKDFKSQVFFPVALRGNTGSPFSCPWLGSQPHTPFHVPKELRTKLRVKGRVLATFSKKAGTELDSAAFPILKHWSHVQTSGQNPDYEFLLRNRVFADVINRKMRSYWITVSSKSKDYCP